MVDIIKVGFYFSQLTYCIGYIYKLLFIHLLTANNNNNNNISTISSLLGNTTVPLSLYQVSVSVQMVSGINKQNIRVYTG